MKILTVLGARPQFIKAGTVSREIKKYDNAIKEIIVHTGQHYDQNMSDIFFDQMKIPKPDYYLGIGNNTHASMTGRMMEKIEEVAWNERPDFILVYGDTDSTLAGAIVASKLHIKLAHIEAGLRSFNMQMPEEVNRILTDRISNILFCPTNVSVNNLKNESFDKFGCKVVKSGDVMLDGAMFYKKFAVKPNFQIDNKFILCTVHRAENTDYNGRLLNIFNALEVVAREIQVIVPLHPRTKKILKNIKFNTKNIDIVDPVGYFEMVWLLQNTYAIMTDSGGLQKEAFFFKKPCITLRNETEWVELVEAGTNILVGANKNKIIKSYKNLSNLDIEDKFKIDLYGNGNASKSIVSELLNF